MSSYSRSYVYNCQSIEPGKHFPFGRIGEPEEVAQLIAFLASDAASFITGQDINVDSGIIATMVLNVRQPKYFNVKQDEK